MPAADLDEHLPGIVAREEAAFAAWLAGAEPALRRALRPFAAAVDVEAVVQETLLRAWQVAPRHQPDGSANSLLRLAHRIGRNLAIDEARRRNRFEPVQPHDPADPVLTIDPTPTPDPLLRRALERCLKGLPALASRALSARLGSGGERDDLLAAALSMKVNTFRQNVTRARKAIRRCLERAGIDLEALLR